MWPFKKKNIKASSKDIEEYVDAVEKLRRMDEYKKTKEMLKTIDVSMIETPSEGMRTKFDKRRERLEERLMELEFRIQEDIKKELGK